MDKPTIMPYQRNYIELESVQPINKPKTNQLRAILPDINIKINKNTLLLHTIAFLLGRAAILQGLTPFGIAFFTALSQKNRKFGPIAITAYLGIATAQGLTTSIPYGFTLIIIYCLFQYILDIKDIKILKTSLVGAAAYLLTTALFLSFGGFYLYDWVIVGFESVIIFAVTYISHYAIPVALQNANRKILSTEEIICVAIIAALALSGIKEVHILGLSIRNVLIAMMIILLAYNGGAGIGAAVGITLGLITSMSTGNTPVIIAIFGFSGLLAGIFKDTGKIGSALGFLMGNTILTFYINGYYEIFLQFKEGLVAFILFLILPATLISQVEKFCNTKTAILNSSKTHSNRMKELTYKRLKEYAGTFGEFAATLEKVSEKQYFFESDDLSKLIERVANKACFDCGMKRNCWDQNFNITYQGILDMLINMEGKGTLSQDGLPKTMRKRCIRPKVITKNVAYLYEINHLNMAWKQRLIENRELVGEQIKGVAKTLKDLATNVNEEIQFDLDLEEAIYVELDKANIPVKNIMAYNSAQGNLEIVVDKKVNPKLSHDTSRDMLISVISQAAGTKLMLKNSSNRDIGEVSLTLVEAEKYSALTKLAAITKTGSELSGDSYTFTNLKGGQYMMALSDGMGTGDKAHVQSSIAIEMLEQMLEAGFNKDIAIKTINSMLMLRSTDEMFTSLDIALIDLYKGKGNFIKVGSVPSLIKRRSGKIEVVESSSLPIGILRDIQIEDSLIDIEDGDLIITLSDGIIDSNKGEGENWLIHHLESNRSLNPQEIADGILHTALKYSKNIPMDDMTVLVTKIWENRD